MRLLNSFERQQLLALHLTRDKRHAFGIVNADEARSRLWIFNRHRFADAAALVRKPLGKQCWLLRRRRQRRAKEIVKVAAINERPLFRPGQMTNGITQYCDQVPVVSLAKAEH